MKLFVGLGNPGGRYAENRHNVGFICLDSIARQEGLKFMRGGLYDHAEQGFGDSKCFLLKPLTYMNLSGQAVGEFASYYKIPSPDIFVILDDINLDLGIVRVRPSGSAGGHNGLQNILDVLGTTDVPRIRIGIGPQPEKLPREAFVLADFRKAEIPLIKTAVETVYSIYGRVRDGTPARDVMNEFNRKNKKDDQGQ